LKRHENLKLLCREQTSNMGGERHYRRFGTSFAAAANIGQAAATYAGSTKNLWIEPNTRSSSYDCVNSRSISKISKRHSHFRRRYRFFINTRPTMKLRMIRGGPMMGYSLPIQPVHYSHAEAQVGQGYTCCNRTTKDASTAAATTSLSSPPPAAAAETAEESGYPYPLSATIAKLPPAIGSIPPATSATTIVSTLHVTI
jgi:hypothetical protein